MQKGNHKLRTQGKRNWQDIILFMPLLFSKQYGRASSESKAVNKSKMKSIIQDNKCCYVCGSTSNLHEHHIFFGSALRKISERYGLKVWLCWYHHTGPEGVHFNKRLDLWLKRIAQSVFEAKHDRTRFMFLIGRNYLENLED